MHDEVNIHQKVLWHVSLKDDIEKTFYPKLLKKIKKSSSFFNSQIDTKIVEVDADLLTNTFFPLYEKEVASRPNYVLDLESVEDRILTRLNQGHKYEIMQLFTKKNDSLIGGTLYAVGEERASIALRVFEREQNKKLKSYTTIDFWAEKCIFNHFKSRNFSYYTHGTDKFPNINRLGHPLFKLKAGARPKISERYKETTVFSLTQLSKNNKDILAFTNPDKEGFFKNALLIDSNSDNKFLINDLKKVMDWIGITVDIV